MAGVSWDETLLPTMRSSIASSHAPESPLARLSPAPRQARGRASQAGKLLRLTLEFMRAGMLVRWRFPRLERDEQLREIQQWSRTLLRIFEIQVDCGRAERELRPSLLVANHLSWLDILVIQSLTPAVFVAKAQVRRWPLIGFMAKACATIFVDRASARSAHAMVDSAASALTRGDTVAVFPEGSSSNGADLAPFHANVFESAIRAKARVQPLTLRYFDSETGAPSEAALFTGDMSLLTSLRKVMQTSSIRVQVHLGDGIPAQGQTRRTLCRQAHQAIRGQLLAHSGPREP